MESIWGKLQAKPKSRTRSKKRLGRGNGSGKGNTCGRGPEGQSSRSGGKVRLQFQGGQNPLVKRLPLLRGQRNIKKADKSVKIVNLSQIEETGLSEIDLRSFLSLKTNEKSKLLGNGDIKKKVKIITDLASAVAVEKIQKSGGSITIIEE